MADTLAFLLSDVSRLLRRRFDERARTIGVTRPQWRVLTILRRQEGIHQAGLADLLEVEPITLCRMVDRLEEAGLVERRRDPNDRRAWCIFLTDTARPILDQLRVLADELMAEALQGVRDDDRDLVSASIQTIRANLLRDEQKEQAANG